MLLHFLHFYNVFCVFEDGHLSFGSRTMPEMSTAFLFLPFVFASSSRSLQSLSQTTVSIDHHSSPPPCSF